MCLATHFAETNSTLKLTMTIFLIFIKKKRKTKRKVYKRKINLKKFNLKRTAITRRVVMTCDDKICVTLRLYFLKKNPEQGANACFEIPHNRGAALSRRATR